MKISVFFISLSLGLFAGCSISASGPNDTPDGYYVMTAGGFNESLNIEFNRDGSYVLNHELFCCVIGPDGELPVTHSREEGTWKLENGVVFFEPKARSPDFPTALVFAPSWARQLVPKNQGSNRLLVNADHPDQFILLRKKKPESDLASGFAVPK